MRLTASLGFAAKYWSALVIFVCSVHRKTEIAVFRRAAMTCGITPFGRLMHLLERQYLVSNGVCSQSSNALAGV